MSRNGQRHPARPRIDIAGPGRSGAQPSPEEAAAIVAAIEQFMRDTAPAPEPPSSAVSPWLRAGLLEATGRPPGAISPWGARGAWGA